MSDSYSNPKDIIRRYNQEILKYYKQQKQDSSASDGRTSTTPDQNTPTPQSMRSTLNVQIQNQQNSDSAAVAPNTRDMRSMTANQISQNVRNIPNIQDSQSTSRTQNAQGNHNMAFTMDNQDNNTPQDNISDRYPEPVIPSYMSSSLLPGVSPSSDYESDGSTGWLSASLAAADNTIPIGDALVLVTDDNNNLLSILITNDSGKTRSISVSTPGKSLSETPSSAIPYSSYNMNVFKKGFYEVIMQNISVFPDTESIQQVNMVPLPFGNPFDTLVFPQTPVNQ